MAVAVVEEVILELLVVVRKVVQQQMDPLVEAVVVVQDYHCLLYTSPSPRDNPASRMPSSA